MPIESFEDKQPNVGSRVFVAATATVVGDVWLGDGANVWYGAVLRGDVERVAIGPGTSFQDNAVGHADPSFPLVIGTDCIVGHLAMIHGATIGDRCLIGIGSLLLNGCEIGEESVVAAGALVTQKKRFPPRSLLMGAPAKVVREVTDEEAAEHVALAQRYVARARVYLEQGSGLDLEAFRRTAGSGGRGGR